MKFEIKGLDQIKKKLEYMKSPKGKEELLTNRICELVPEAKSVKRNFKFQHDGSSVKLSIEGLSPELHAKITNALSK